MDLFLKRHIRLFALLLFAICCFWLLIRSCSSKNHHVVYRIARDPNWESLQLMNREKALLAFSNDLFEAIGNEEQIAFSLYSEPTDALLASLNQDRYDAIVVGTTPSAQLKENYLFSHALYLLGNVMVVRASPKNRLEDINEALIGIPKNLSLPVNLEQYPNALTVPYDNIIKALTDLGENVIDGVVMQVTPAYIYTTGFFAGKLKILWPPLDEEGIRLMAKKTKKGQELVDAVNEGLKELKKQGTYHELLVKWGLAGPEF